MDAEQVDKCPKFDIRHGFQKTGRKKAIVVPKFKCLPTSEAFEENVKRALLQVCIWIAALHLKPLDLDPTQFGWSKDELNKVLMPVILPTGIEAAPASILEMIRFGCGSEEPCSTARCECFKGYIACNIFSKYNATVSCQNPLTIIARAADVDDETMMTILRKQQTKIHLIKLSV